MSKSELEIVSVDEFDAIYPERLRTEELTDDVFYTFMGRVRGVGKRAVKGLVRLEYTDTIPHSSGMRAHTRMVMFDTDLQPTMRLDSHLLHGIWLPQSSNSLVIQRPFSQPVVDQGFFVPNDNGGDIDPAMLEEWTSEFSDAYTPSSELVDA